MLDLGTSYSLLLGWKIWTQIKFDLRMCTYKNVVKLTLFHLCVFTNDFKVVEKTTMYCYKERGMKNVCNLTDLNWLLWLRSKILDGSGKFFRTYVLHFFQNTKILQMGYNLVAIFKKMIVFQNLPKIWADYLGGIHKLGWQDEVVTWYRKCQ